jgi:heat-inducible transcriptional repressor
VLDERKLTVLRAIVEDYVSTTEPVGSKSLVDRHHFDVSPATIRNDMAVLEEQGFIAQPHTSAGRVPTDKGYRLFVDRLSNVKPLSAAEPRAQDRRWCRRGLPGGNRCSKARGLAGARPHRCRHQSS